MTLRELTESTDYLAELDEFPVERWRSSFGWIGPNGEDIVPQSDRDYVHADLVKYIPGATKYTKLIELYQKGWNRWYKQEREVYFMMHSGGRPNPAQLRTIKKISTDLFMQSDVEKFSIEYKTPEKYEYIEYQKPAELNQYLGEQVTEEGWKPKNKSKHKACQERVKNRVSVWPSAYASAQVVQCYYGRKGKKKKKVSEALDTQKFYHGTSDVFLRDIENNGLQTNEKGRLYITTNPFTAKVEAYNTVIGDMGYGITQWPPNPREIKTPGVGGNAIVIELDAKQIDSSNIKKDPEYFDEDQAYYLEIPVAAEAIDRITKLGSKPSTDVIQYLMGEEPNDH